MKRTDTEYCALRMISMKFMDDGRKGKGGSLHYVSTTYQLRINYASTTYQLRINYVSTTYQLRINYVSTTHQLRISYVSIKGDKSTKNRDRPPSRIYVFLQLFISFKMI